MSSSPPVSPTPLREQPAGNPDSLVDLVRQLASQGSHLAEQQLALIRAEVREAAGDAKAAVGGFAGAALLGVAGLGVVLMGVGHLLGDALDNPGLGILLVGVVSVVIAWLLYGSARKKIDSSNLMPERSRDTLARAPAAMRGALNTEHKP